MKNILIVEGILIFVLDRLLELCVLKYFLTITKPVMFTRKLERKYRYDSRYIDHVVWPMYEYYKSDVISKTNNDHIVFLDGLNDLNDNVRIIVDDIRSKLKHIPVPISN